MRHNAKVSVAAAIAVSMFSTSCKKIEDEEQSNLSQSIVYDEDIELIFKGNDWEKGRCPYELHLKVKPDGSVVWEIRRALWENLGSQSCYSLNAETLESGRIVLNQFRNGALRGFLEHYKSEGNYSLITDMKPEDVSGCATDEFPSKPLYLSISINPNDSPDVEKSLTINWIKMDRSQKLFFLSDRCEDLLSTKKWIGLDRIESALPIHNLLEKINWQWFASKTKDNTP